MLDPWHVTIAALAGAWPPPCASWPAAMARRVVAPPDLMPNLKLPPEPKPEQVPEIDLLVLEALRSLGEASVRELAVETMAPKSTVWRSLDGLRRRGRVRSDGKGWAPA